jgi:hypothetical protein
MLVPVLAAAAVWLLAVIAFFVGRRADVGAVRDAAAWALLVSGPLISIGLLFGNAALEDLRRIGAVAARAPACRVSSAGRATQRDLGRTRRSLASGVCPGPAGGRLRGRPTPAPTTATSPRDYASASRLRPMADAVAASGVAPPHPVDDHPVLPLDMLHAHDHLLSRRDRLERAIAELAVEGPWAPTVARLRCLRGIDTLSARRALRRGRLLRALRAPPARRLSGHRAHRELLRPAAPPGRDHQGRLQTRPPAACRGGLALPPPTPRLRRPAPPPPGPARLGDRLRLARPAPAAPALAAPWRPSLRRRPAQLTAVAVARALSTFCWELATHD